MELCIYLKYLRFCRTVFCCFIFLVKEKTHLQVYFPSTTEVDHIVKNGTLQSSSQKLCPPRISFLMIEIIGVRKPWGSIINFVTSVIIKHDSNTIFYIQYQKKNIDESFVKLLQFKKIF